MYYSDYLAGLSASSTPIGFSAREDAIEDEYYDEERYRANWDFMRKRLDEESIIDDEEAWSW